MKVFLYFCIAWFSIASCSRKMSTESTTAAKDTSTVFVSSGGLPHTPLLPPCIQKRIDSIKAQHVWNPPAEIHLYEYNGQKVWSFSADCCDQFTTVVDENCHYICAPSGGFTGKGDRKCTDFDQQAKHIALVWKDERTRK